MFSEGMFSEGMFSEGCGLCGGESSEKFRGPGVDSSLTADSGADAMRLWKLPREGFDRLSVLVLLTMSAAGCSTFRIDSWWRSVCAELSMVLVLRTDSEGDMLRS